MQTELGELRQVVQQLSSLQARTTQEQIRGDSSSGELALVVHSDPTRKHHRDTVLGLCESLSRAEAALQAAQRVAMGASQSFASECENVGKARRDLEQYARCL